jgi:mannobiose 2-epimerase
MKKDALNLFKLNVKKELDENIVPFWVNRTIDSAGGFVGQMTNEGKVIENAPKGLILNTRILWTFSALYIFQKNPVYQRIAKRAYDYLLQYFWDKRYGGVFWTLDRRGEPIEDKKQAYGQAFAIYALSEFHKAFGSSESIQKAKSLFDLTERYTRDDQNEGYIETLTRDLRISENQRLSEVDLAEKKSNNTQLHMFEAYANLYEVWQDPLLEKRLETLLFIFITKIITKDTKCHCQLFFDEQWNPKSDHISFGHDIESAWLLCRAAEILGNPKLLEAMQKKCLSLAEAVYQNGLDNKKSLFYEADSKSIVDSDKHWWVQVEAVVGFLNAYQLSGYEKYLDVALNIWKFIEDYIIDRKNGEWFYKVDSKGLPDSKSLKVSEWKCPYHNVRGCIEIIKRIENILNQKTG